MKTTIKILLTSMLGVLSIGCIAVMAYTTFSLLTEGFSWTALLYLVLYSILFIIIYQEIEVIPAIVDKRIKQEEEVS